MYRGAGDRGKCADEAASQNFRSAVRDYNDARRRVRILTVMALEPGAPKETSRTRALERHARAEARVRHDELLAKTRAFIARHQANLNYRNRGR
jgi:hypothetical protein